MVNHTVDRGPSGIRARAGRTASHTLGVFMLAATVLSAATSLCCRAKNVTAALAAASGVPWPAKASISFVALAASRAPTDAAVRAAAQSTFAWFGGAGSGPPHMLRTCRHIS